MRPEMYEFFNRVEEHHWWFQARRDIVLNLLALFAPSDRPMRVLDIGCGTGMMVNALRQFGEVFGIDPDEHAIAYSRRRITDPTRVHKGQLPDGLPRDQRFEIVTLLDVLEHVEDDVGSLRAIREVLNPRGILFLTVPAFPFLWSGHDEINQHKRRYTVSELTLKLQYTGFKILKCSYFNTFLFPMAFAFKIFNRIRWGDAPRSHIESVPSSIVNAALRRIFSFERFLLPRVNFPFGVSLLAIASSEPSPGLGDKHPSKPALTSLDR
jgi:SAM-dependent methyltransferase